MEEGSDGPHLTCSSEKKKLFLLKHIGRKQEQHHRRERSQRYMDVPRGQQKAILLKIQHLLPCSLLAAQISALLNY